MRGFREVGKSFLNTFRPKAKDRVPPEAREAEGVQSDSSGDSLAIGLPPFVQRRLGRYTVEALDEFRRAQVIISSTTPLHEIIQHLTSSGCRNLTSQLVSSSAYPVSRGGFGDVYRGALDDQRQVAIKALRVSLHAEDELDKVPKHAAQELYTWSKCNHPNILPLLGLVEFQGQIRMISLWLENGSLPSYLDKHPGIDCCIMSVQVCEGLEYLHDIGVVHGDLKGQNILVSDDQTPMITDFGNALLQQGTLMFTETKHAPQFTPRWTAPELMEEDGIRQSQEADVYALGMTILEIITGKVPYYYINNVLAMIRTIAIKRELPRRPEENIPSNSRHGDVLWSLLEGCWEFEPMKRPSTAEVAKIMSGITREGLIPGQAGTEGPAQVASTSGQPAVSRDVE